MTTTYKRYLKLNIDGSPVGFGPGGSEGEGECNCFCTPKGAKVIGWAGVDGIHYCFVRGFGETVFAVSPLNTPGNYVHPVARNFRDFLRLLLACGDTAALEQAWDWAQARFNTFLRDNPLTAEQQTALDIIGKRLLLTPMEQPFAYIKELQAEFAYSRLKYTEAYYDWVPAEPKIPEWKVYFDGNFWGHHGRERAGKEISLHKQFVWADEVWHIPAIYTCSQGLIVDFCVQVPPERIRSFMEKWNPSLENNGSDFTAEQRMQIRAENPLDVNVNTEVVLNGTVLSSSHSCGVSWNPCFPEDNGLESRSVIRHYGLDPASGWAIWRAAFPWKTKRKPQLRSLSVTLMQEPVAMPGPHFHVSAPGEQIEFTHPTTRLEHTLTVQEYEQREIPPEHFTDQNQEFPTHYTVMSYTLSPDLPDNAFSVTDCVGSDHPRQKHINPNEPQAVSSIFVALFGVADTPTAAMFGGTGQGKLRAVCSALHFEPVDVVEWRMVFYEKRREDVSVELI